MMSILSIQSHVSYGHVGNSAAVFALQRLGIDVWPIYTVQFSNHTGYDFWRGDIFSQAQTLMNDAEIASYLKKFRKICRQAKITLK